MSYLFITHNIGEVESIADHIAMMRAGRIEQQGGCSELLIRCKVQRTKLTRLIKGFTILSISSKYRPMSKTTSSAAFLDGVLTLQPFAPKAATGPRTSEAGQAGHTYLIRVQSDVLSKVLEAVVPVLGQLLSEKTSEVREQKLEALVDFMAGQMVVPSAVDTQMAQRLAARHARVLNEFGFVTAEQLADANQSRAANRNALADNWKKRRQVFAVRHRDESGRQREVFPLFQFDDHKPIKAVQGVLAAFGERKAPWKIALWFTSNNGWLPGQARPVDVLASAPGAVVQAAQRDAAGSGA